MKQSQLFTSAGQSSPVPSQSYPSASARESSVVREAVNILQRRLVKNGILLNDNSSVKDYLYLKHGLNTKKEFFGILYLDAKNRLNKEEILFHGSIMSCPVYVRTICDQILTNRAAAIILFHIHPSGVVDPSNEDKIITRRIAALAGLLDVTIHDHFIIGAEGCFSFRENIPSYLSFSFSQIPD